MNLVPSQCVFEQKFKFYPSVFQEKSQALVGFPLQNKGVG